jgi:glycosyltransferase involved in cell wall biosynthesis
VLAGDTLILDTLTLLWVIDFEYATRLHHGAMLRYVNYSREMLSRGHAVHLATLLPKDRLSESRDWFRSLQDEGVISGFVELHYQPPRSRVRLGAPVPHPAARNALLRHAQEITAGNVARTAADLGVNCVLLSSRRLMFLASRLPPGMPYAIDWADSFPLYHARQVRTHVRKRRWRQALSAVRPLTESALLERYYGRRAPLNLSISPADKLWLDRLTRRPATSAVVLNGVTLNGSAVTVARDPRRIIFSGNMSFPPNYEGALWFLDNVFPAVRARRPDAKLVLAGANPTPALVARAGAQVEVTGYVEDMNAEIQRSAVYVAPLVSGGGFKNKVVEAVANRTYVVATPLAVEFLAPRFHQFMSVASDPQRMAAAIVDVLDHPEQVAAKVDALYEQVAAEFSWSHRTTQLLNLLQTVRDKAAESRI